MSKSLQRVEATLLALGIAPRITEYTAETRTAEQAATQAGCQIDQIVKSIVFGGPDDTLFLFLTAGGNRVDTSRASALAGAALGRADPDLVRARTGFAIGGVAPVGHLTHLPVWMDPRLMDFETVWAAAGTPRHIFAVAPTALANATRATIATFTG